MPSMHGGTTRFAFHLVCCAVVNPVLVWALDQVV
jgi:hypothetical protein